MSGTQKRSIVDAGIAAGYDIRPGDNAGGLTVYGLVTELIRDRDSAKADNARLTAELAAYRALLTDCRKERDDYKAAAEEEARAYDEAGSALADAVRERDEAVEVLQKIRNYDSGNGCCPYGCDTPHIASRWLKERAFSARQAAKQGEVGT